MLTGIRRKAVLIPWFMLLTVVVACGGGPSKAEIEDAVMASMVASISASTAYNQGLYYYQQFDYENALTQYDEAIRLYPKYTDAYHSRGAAYHHLRQYQRAIQDYDEAIRLNPQNSLAYHDRGLAYQLFGQQHLADRDFAKAREIGLDP